MHPLAPDLSTVSDDELAKKYNDLNRRLGQAYRSGPSQIIPQIQMLMQPLALNMLTKPVELILRCFFSFRFVLIGYNIKVKILTQDKKLSWG